MDHEPSTQGMHQATMPSSDAFEQFFRMCRELAQTARSRREQARQGTSANVPASEQACQQAEAEPAEIVESCPLRLRNPCIRCPRASRTLRAGRAPRVPYTNPQEHRT